MDVTLTKQFSFSCGSNGCSLALKAPKKGEDEEEEVQEGTVSLAAVKETSADAALAAFLSELNSIFILKKTKEGCLLWKIQFCLDSQLALARKKRKKKR